jgi:hypothetical protein
MENNHNQQRILFDGLSKIDHDDDDDDDDDDLNNNNLVIILAIINNHYCVSYHGPKG